MEISGRQPNVSMALRSFCALARGISDIWPHWHLYRLTLVISINGAKSAGSIEQAFCDFFNFVFLSCKYYLLW